MLNSQFIFYSKYTTVVADRIMKCITYFVPKYKLMGCKKQTNYLCKNVMGYHLLTKIDSLSGVFADFIGALSAL